MIAILRILAQSEQPLGATTIASQLEEQGIRLSERQIRYHLKIMEERGLTQSIGQAGRVLTEKGLDEIQSAMISDKVGFVVARIDRLAYATTFDVNTGKGEIVLNVSFLPADELPAALQVMKPVIEAGLSMSDLVIIAREGERLGERVPPGMVAIGTVCSVTLNGVLLRGGVPVESRFGGLLEIRGRKPLRFVELVSYAGSTLDPLQIFITGQMTSAYQAAVTGNGKVGASLRDLPAVALPRALELIERLKDYRLGGVIAVGDPNQPLLQIPVGFERAGLVVIGGLTPMAAVTEHGLQVKNLPMSTTCDFSLLQPIWEL